MNFRRTLSFSAIESIASRGFDLLILWVVFNSLSTEDVALFGVATASVFIFNFFLLTPETALLKYQKEWLGRSELTEYMSAFFSFSLLKSFLLYFLAISYYIINGEMNWFFYAVVFSLITQKIQMAEICRIYFRMELQQDRVALFEFISKAFLLFCICILFFYPSIKVYFLCYFLWGVMAAFFWLYRLRRFVFFSFSFTQNTFKKLKSAMLGYSLWTHITGVMTLFIYNANVLFLKWLDLPIEDVALFTVVNKVSNLFFVIPMFFQSFVPVLLANGGKGSRLAFNKILIISAAISIFQFLFFLIAGSYLGAIFGIEENELSQFYGVGLIMSAGIMVLNISRPLSTFLLVRVKAQRVMLGVFVPSFILALIIYPVSIYLDGINGAAYSALSIYMAMAILLIFGYFKYGVKTF